MMSDQPRHQPPAGPGASTADASAPDDASEEPRRDEVVGDNLGGNAGDVAAESAVGDIAEGQADAGEAAEPDWEQLAGDDPRSRAELLAELAAAESRRDEYLEDVRRGRAEFENYRKRVMREGAAQRAAGKADVAAALLDVLDDFDRTLAAAESSAELSGPPHGHDDGLAKGVELVYGKLANALQAAGLERLDDVGAPFDPNRHEAVQQLQADEPRDEPVVAEILRPGYAMAGRTLRAAMVAVEQ